MILVIAQTFQVTLPDACLCRLCTGCPTIAILRVSATHFIYILDSIISDFHFRFQFPTLRHFFQKQLLVVISSINHFSGGHATTIAFITFIFAFRLTWTWFIFRRRWWWRSPDKVVGSKLKLALWVTTLHSKDWPRVIASRTRPWWANILLSTCRQRFCLLCSIRASVSRRGCACMLRLSGWPGKRSVNSANILL